MRVVRPQNKRAQAKAHLVNQFCGLILLIASKRVPIVIQYRRVPMVSDEQNVSAVHHAGGPILIENSTYLTVQNPDEVPHLTPERIGGDMRVEIHAWKVNDLELGDAMFAEGIQNRVHRGFINRAVNIKTGGPLIGNTKGHITENGSYALRRRRCEHVRASVDRCERHKGAPVNHFE
jgi:hypothetical protein